MFELPQAKRVRREDLRSRSSSPESSGPDVQTQEDIRSRLNRAFGQVDDVSTVADATAMEPSAEPPAQQDDDEEEALEFRLFAPTKRPVKPLDEHVKTNAADTVKDSTITKIRLDAEEDPDAPPGFVIPSRPQSYYFQPTLTPSILSKLQASALSGPQIFSLAVIPWPGTHLPWKLSKWQTPPSQTSQTKNSLIRISDNPQGANKPKPKCRKSKKTRIALRIKTAAARNKRELEAMGEAERAEADKEKRARRNREKKLKRRDKAREVRALAGELGLPVGLLEGRK